MHSFKNCVYGGASIGECAVCMSACGSKTTCTKMKVRRDARCQSLNKGSLAEPGARLATGRTRDLPPALGYRHF